MRKITASAPTLTTSDASLASTDSSRGVIAGWMNGFQMLRVKVLAAPIDITAAGTSAPSAIAAKQKPANQSGNAHSTSCGTASWGEETLTPAAIAITPSSAMSPSTNE